MKNYCRHCGEKLDPQKEHICPKQTFWQKIKQFFIRILKNTGMGNAQSGEKDYYERGKVIVPDAIKPDEGEIVVKQYNLALLRSRLKLTWAEGRMMITNKRLLFRSAGWSPAGKVVYQQEFAIDKVDGLEVRKDNRFMVMDLFLGWLATAGISFFGVMLGNKLAEANEVIAGIIALTLGIIACVPFFLLYKHYYVKMLSSGFAMAVMMTCQAAMPDGKLFIWLLSLVELAVLATWLISFFLSCFKPNLVVEVKTSGGTPGMQLKHKYASLLVWKKMEENSGFAEILPWEDTDLAIEELNTIISDLKTLGDMGVEKWNV